MMTKEQIEYLRSLIDANPEAELLVETDDVIALLDEVDRLRDEMRLAEARGHDAGAALHAVGFYGEELVGPKEAVRRGQTARVLQEVAAERRRQHAQWGEQNLRDFRYRGGETDLIKSTEIIRQMANSDEKPSWALVLLEEVAEAIEECCPPKMRAELVQVAAVAVQWIEAIDRRGGSK